MFRRRNHFDRFISLLSLALIAGAVSLPSCRKIPSGSPDEPVATLLFQSDRDGDFEIMTMFPDGSGIRQLTFNTAGDEYASWSPDRRAILFQSDRDGKWNIYTMNPDGGNQRRLTDNRANSCSACWSADGRFIYFDSDELGGWGIYRILPDGSGKIAFKPAKPGERNILAAFSPDGRKLVFTTDRGRGWQICVADADGSHEQLLGADGGGCRAHWSPDSRLLAFVSSKRDGKGDVWIGNPDGSGERCLTESPDYDYCPTWSPDGKKIVYAATPDKKNGNWDLYLISVSGGPPIRLTHDPARENNPYWQ